MFPETKKNRIAGLMQSLLLSLVLCSGAPQAFAWNGFDLSNFGFEEERQFHIRVDDGTRLAGHLIVPARAERGQRLPAIVLIDDWVRTPGELILQSASFAAEGFIVLRYQARGYGHSSGTLDFAGERDLADFAAVLRWLAENAPVDRDRIGAVGVSAGGAIALIGAAEGYPLRAVAALSSWVDLGSSLFRNGAGNPEWAMALGDPGVPRRVSAQDAQRIKDLASGISGAEGTRWARSRSVRPRLAQLNQRGVPVFLANGYQDELVDLNGQFSFFEQLQVPKRMVLSQSEHAALEAHELLAEQRFLWGNTLDWIRSWLTQDGKGVVHPLVSMELGEVSVRDEFTRWPSPLVEEASFHLTPREASGHGGIAKKPWAGKVAVSNTLTGGTDSAASLTMTAASAADHSDLPTAVWLPNLDHKHSIVFESRGLARPLPLRGTPSVDLWLSSSTENAQLVVYLYEANDLGLARLISHGGGAVNVIPNQPFPLRVDLRPIAYDLQPGKRVVLVIDTEDPRYTFANRNENFALRMLFSEEHRPMLRMPYNRTLVDPSMRVAGSSGDANSQP